MKRPRKPKGRRNPLVAATRRLGHRVKRSALTYRRQPKHRSPRPTDEGFWFL